MDRGGDRDRGTWRGKGPDRARLLPGDQRGSGRLGGLDGSCQRRGASRPTPLRGKDGKCDGPPIQSVLVKKTPNKLIFWGSTMKFKNLCEAIMPLVVASRGEPAAPVGGKFCQERAGEGMPAGITLHGVGGI